MEAMESARFARVLKVGDTHYAEVEVVPVSGRPVLLAWFSTGEDERPVLHTIFEKDADPDVDWYDNNLHTAIDDVTEQLFDDKSSKAAARAEFGEAILAFGDVRRQVAAELRRAAAVRM